MMWGFKEGPNYMTENGLSLFINVVSYMCGLSPPVEYIPILLALATQQPTDNTTLLYILIDLCVVSCSTTLGFAIAYTKK